MIDGLKKFFFKEEPNFIIETISPYYAENIDEIFSKTDVPEWFKNINIQRTPKEWIDKGLPVDAGTIKTCPGVIDILTNSWVIKSPCDFHVEIDRVNGGWRYVTPYDKMNIISHDLSVQVSPDNILTNNYFNLKITTLMRIRSNVVTRGIFMQPIYHSTHNWIVMPGTAKFNPKVPFQFNLNLLIKIKGEEALEYISVKKGDVLAYLYTPDHKIKNVNTNLMGIDEFNAGWERMCFRHDAIRRMKEKWIS